MKFFDTIGSDPEFVVIGKSPVSMVGIVGGTKEHPQPIQIDGCCCLTDNVLVEFTIPPCSNFSAVKDYIDRCVVLTQTELQKINSEWTLNAISSVEFPESELQSEQAQSFGCTPSSNIYTPNGLSVLVDINEVGNNRCIGFHLHFGWIDLPTEEERKDFIFLCDLFLGVPSYIYDKDRLRRSWYGKIGEHRIKDFGVEYRSLGAGMYHFPKVIQQGLDNIKLAIENDKIEHLKYLYFDTMSYISLSNNLSVNQAKKLHKEILKDLN